MSEGDTATYISHSVADLENSSVNNMVYQESSDPVLPGPGLVTLNYLILIHLGRLHPLFNPLDPDRSFRYLSSNSFDESFEYSYEVQRTMTLAEKAPPRGLGLRLRQGFIFVT